MKVHYYFNKLTLLIKELYYTSNVFCITEFVLTNFIEIFLQKTKDLWESILKCYK